MKIATILISLFVCVVATYGGELSMKDHQFWKSLRNGYRARVTLRIVDESGAPVPGAKVGAHFQIESRRGIEGLSDANGLFVLEDITRGEFHYGVEKEGYYTTMATVRLMKEGVLVKDGKWQPWDPEVPVVLRRIVNPIPMYAKRIETHIPDVDTDFGYDLVIGDWLPPVGNGIVADFIFRITGEWNNYRDNDSTLHLRFSDQQNGLLRIEKNDIFGDGSHSGSEFIWPRFAPDSGYLQKHQWRMVRKMTDEKSSDHIVNETDENARYFFRIRSEMIDNGGVKNALYGKLRGDVMFTGAAGKGKRSWIRFTYYLNPTPNDRNMEFDPRRNLFKSFKGAEQVSEP